MRSDVGHKLVFELDYRCLNYLSESDTNINLFSNIGETGLQIMKEMGSL